MTDERMVLAAIDDSPVSDLVLERAMAMVRDPAKQLRVVMVIPPVIGHWMTLEGRAFSTPTPLTDLENALAADFRKRVLRRVQAAGLPDDVATVSYGAPAPEILACAEAIGADTIVVGSHGKGLVERVVVGSTAEAVLHRATCHVLLVVPTPEAKAA